MITEAITIGATLEEKQQFRANIDRAIAESPELLSGVVVSTDLNENGNVQIVYTLNDAVLERFNCAHISDRWHIMGTIFKDHAGNITDTWHSRNMTIEILKANLAMLVEAMRVRGHLPTHSDL